MCIHKLYFGTTCVECQALQLYDVLKKLVDKMNVVSQNPEYMHVWYIAQLHNGPYAGPQYEEEHKAAEKLLKELA